MVRSRFGHSSRVLLVTPSRDVLLRERFDVPDFDDDDDFGDFEGDYDDDEDDEGYDEEE